MKGIYAKGKTAEMQEEQDFGQCSGATRVPSGSNTASEEPMIRRSKRG